MIDVYISVIPGGYRIKCSEKSFSMRYYFYTKKQAIQRVRADAALQNKHLNITEV